MDQPSRAWAEAAFAACSAAVLGDASASGKRRQQPLAVTHEIDRAMCARAKDMTTSEAFKLPLMMTAIHNRDGAYIVGNIELIHTTSARRTIAAALAALSEDDLRHEERRKNYFCGVVHRIARDWRKPHDPELCRTLLGWVARNNSTDGLASLREFNMLPPAHPMPAKFLEGAHPAMHGVLQQLQFGVPGPKDDESSDDDDDSASSGASTVDEDPPVAPTPPPLCAEDEYDFMEEYGFGVKQEPLE